MTHVSNSTKLKTSTKKAPINVAAPNLFGRRTFQVSLSEAFPWRSINSLAATWRSSKIDGINSAKFNIPINTFIQPAAVYIFKWIIPRTRTTPWSPSIVTPACSAGPMMKPKTCIKLTMDTAFVRSSIFVAELM